MKHNHYIKALRVDEEAVRKPWDQSAFSRALDRRERTLKRQTLVSSILEKITFGSFALGILLVAFKSPYGWPVLAAALCMGLILCLAYLWITFSAWLNIIKFEDSLYHSITPSAAADTDTEAER